ncbi:hypothetical protein PENTCL1PPCAC_13393, partial [Pristionchus entomophagus]
VNCIAKSVDGNEQFLQINDDILDLDLIRKVIAHFNIEELNFLVDSESQLEKYLQLMADHPHTRKGMILEFLPVFEKLLSIPSMEKLTVRSSAAQYSTDDETQWRIPCDIFFNLLSAHKNLNLGRVKMTSEECERAMEIISAVSRERKVDLFLADVTTSDWLENIPKSSKPGDLYGKLIYVRNFNTADSRHDYDVQLRFGNCWIRIQGIEFTGSDFLSRVTMTNRV